MHLRIACSLILLIASGAPTLAQEFNDTNSFGVNANFSVQMPLDSKATTADMAKTLAQLTQQLGDLANRECDVLSDTFKAECHVTQMNIGTNVNERRNRRLNGPGNEGEQQKFVNANVQATFTLTPNAAAPKPAPTSTP